MDEFKVVMEDVAIDDLRRIVRYIDEERFAPMAAINLEKNILNAVSDLAFSPYWVFYNKRRGIRKCTVGNYLILFRIQENTIPKRVVVTQIIDGRRNLRRWVR